jgi:hypothetical protein
MKPNQLSPEQLRPLECPHCLGRIFVPFNVVLFSVDRLDPKNLVGTPGLSHFCGGCWKLFDPQVAAGLKPQEIKPA